MKNRIVKKIMRTLLLVIIFAAVGGTLAEGTAGNYGV